MVSIGFNHLLNDTRETEDNNLYNSSCGMAVCMRGPEKISAKMIRDIRCNKIKSD